MAFKLSMCIQLNWRFEGKNRSIGTWKHQSTMRITQPKQFHFYVPPFNSNSWFQCENFQRLYKCTQSKAECLRYYYNPPVLTLDDASLDLVVPDMLLLNKHHHNESLLSDAEALQQANFANIQNIAPYDISANTPQGAYPLDKLIISEEWEHLDVHELKLAAKKAKEYDALGQKKTYHTKDTNNCRCLV